MPEMEFSPTTHRLETEISPRPPESPCPDLVVVGNLLVDDVVYEDGCTRMRQPGGAALYFALGASLWDVSVGIVSRVGDDYPNDVLRALGERRIDLSGVRSIGRESLRTWLLYEGVLRRVVHRLEGPTHAEVSPVFAEIPLHWLESRAVHLAPMPFDLQSEFVQAFRRYPDVHVSLDPYDLLTEDRVAAWRELLTDVDLILFSEDEMEVAGGRQDPNPVLRRLEGDGRLRHILFKQGPRGGTLHTPARWLSPTHSGHSRWEPRPGPVVDATGAGDAFAGGVLAAVAGGKTMRQGIEMGRVAASFALEAPGPEGLLTATHEEAQQRLADGSPADE